MIDKYLGKKVGTFTFISIHHIDKKQHHRKYYNVICDCGTKRVIDSHYARRKQRNFCRCRDNRSSKDICLDQLYQRYKYGSSKRKTTTIDFNIDKSMFIELVLSKCRYCNKEPANTITVNKKHKLKYNGIDRLNNNIGYLNNNCVSCCWECNQAKKNKSFEEFKMWINKVHLLINNQDSSNGQ